VRADNTAVSTASESVAHDALESPHGSDQGDDACQRAHREADEGVPSNERIAPAPAEYTAPRHQHRRPTPPHVWLDSEIRDDSGACSNDRLAHRMAKLLQRLPRQRVMAADDPCSQREQKERDREPDRATAVHAAGARI
jgi:hypothetical protein